MAVVKAYNFLGISCFGGVPLQAIAGGCLFYETRLEGVDTQFPHQLGGMSVPYWNTLCRFNELPAGVRQSQEEDTNIFRGTVLGINGTGATPKAKHSTPQFLIHKT